MRSRIRVQAYGNGKSKSAKLLAKELGVLRIKANGSKFRGKIGDVVINWGMPKNVLERVKYLNPIQGISIASNKLKTLITLQEKGISIPEFRTSKPTEGKWVARTLLTSHSGRGIGVGESDSLPDAPLYVKYIDKVAEYRVIVVNGRAVDVKSKKKKREWSGERSDDVWNHTNGYVFARNVGEFPVMLCRTGVDAVKALGLTYGAVDIIEDAEGILYVLECNTAFGLEGTTVTLVAEAIKELL